MTYRYVINSLITTLKSTFKDADITERLVAYWVVVNANRILKGHLKNLDYKEGSHLSTFSAIPVLFDTVTKRKYIEMPKAVFEWAHNLGIEYVTYEYQFDENDAPIPNWQRIKFQPTTPAESERLGWSPYEQPSPKNPYFYTMGNQLRFLGIEAIKVDTIELCIYATISPQDSFDMAATINLPDELINQLIYDVLAMGAFMLQVPKERIEEGDDDRSGKGIPRLSPPAKEPNA